MQSIDTATFLIIVHIYYITITSLSWIQPNHIAIITLQLIVEDAVIHDLEFI